jgi:hypothetical protein
MGTARALSEPVLAFKDSGRARAALVVRVNFGVYAGRNATQAEIDDLARGLHHLVDSFAILAEERHEFGGDVEATIRQIVIEIEADVDTREVITRAEEWARSCIAARSDLGELSGL